jgi:hypothetical protein
MKDRWPGSISPAEFRRPRGVCSPAAPAVLVSYFINRAGLLKSCFAGRDHSRGSFSWLKFRRLEGQWMMKGWAWPRALKFGNMLAVEGPNDLY